MQTTQHTKQNNSKHIITTLLLTSALGFNTQSTLASDIAYGISKGSNHTNADNGGYFEIGAIANCWQGPLAQEDPNDDKNNCNLGFVIAGEYQWRGLFIEASQYSHDGLNLGYTLWHNDNTRIDLLAASISGTYTQETDTPKTQIQTQADKDEAIWDRNTLYAGAGVRLTHYWNDNIIQLRLVSDIHDGNGAMATARFGRAWQVKNWNFHALVGLSAISQKTNQYFWGISEEQATERFAHYDAKASIGYNFEIGATYPISENWVSRTNITAGPLSKTAKDSPRSVASWGGQISTSINYVF